MVFSKEEQVNACKRLRDWAKDEEKAVSEYEQEFERRQRADARYPVIFRLIANDERKHANHLNKIIEDECKGA